MRAVEKGNIFSAVARANNRRIWKQNTAYYDDPWCQRSERVTVCVLLFSSAWLCVFNLYLVFAIIAFSCNWHIECVCVCECVWNARARENNSRFVRWRAARAVGWVRAHARRAWERTHSRVCREWWAREISVSVCGYLDRACVRDFCLLSFHYAIVLSHASRRARFLTCLNR